MKRGLAEAFRKFDEYRLAKYDRDGKIKLKDALFMVHAKPKDEQQADLWKRLVAGTLEAPDTWEVALSAGQDKRETFERLMREGKLGGLAVLRNLRGMLQAGVDVELIRERLAQGAHRAFPYRFVVAAKYAPQIEDSIETAMFRALEGVENLPGDTGLLIDVSGSMDAPIGQNHGMRARTEETSRVDVAAGLAILIREKCQRAWIATFSESLVGIPPRRGFALRDAIKQSQPHSSTYLSGALRVLRTQWPKLDRIIVITDEQSQDGIESPWAKRSFVVNVAPYKNGISYRNGWNHIDGWSEKVIDFIREYEALEA